VLDDDDDKYITVCNRIRLEYCKLSPELSYMRHGIRTVITMQ